MVAKCTQVSYWFLQSLFVEITEMLWCIRHPPFPPVSGVVCLPVHSLDSLTVVENVAGDGRLPVNHLMLVTTGPALCRQSRGEGNDGPVCNDGPRKPVGMRAVQSPRDLTEV